MEKSILDNSEKRNMLGKVKDAFDDIKPNQTKSLKENKPITPEDAFRKNEKIKKIKLRNEKIKKFMILFVSPDIYAEFIQRFENLLQVIFIDSFYVLLLFSIVYGMYIIYNFDSYDFKSAISKFVGAVIVSIVCIIVQINIHDKPNKT